MLYQTPFIPQPWIHYLIIILLFLLFPRTLISLTHFSPPSSQMIYLYSAELFILQNLSKILFSSINISLSSTTRFNCTTLWILAEFVSTYFIHSPLIFSTLRTCLNEHLPNLLHCKLFKSRSYMLHLSLGHFFGLFPISTSKTPTGPITQFIYLIFRFWYPLIGS